MNERLRKAEIGIFIMFTLVLIVLAIKHPQITGMAVGSGLAYVDPDVIEELETNEYVSVMIALKETPEKGKSKQSLKEKKVKVKEVQDDVLSSVDYSTDDNSTKDLKLRHKYATIGALGGTINQKGLEKLRRHPRVESITKEKMLRIDLAESLPLINATNVHAMSISGTSIKGGGITICVLDTGIDYDHADLGGGWGNRVLDGYDFAYSDTDPADDHGHGTHVAGIIAGNGGITGVAPEANLIALKVCDEFGNCGGQQVVAGIDWCVNNASLYNISVISMSLGGLGPFNTYCDGLSTIETASIDAAVGNGMMVVASTGNDGWTNGIAFPACIKNSTAVGSVDDGSAGTADDVSSFTNRGAIIDLLAPGNLIYSTAPGGGHVSNSGTSMAAPHVSGAAALIYQYERLLNNKNATAIEVEGLLKRTGKKIDDTVGYIPRVDVIEAIYGILNVSTSDNQVQDLQKKAKIRYKTNTDLSKASEAFVFDDNLISLNSSKYPELNAPADLTLYNLRFGSTPVILKDGEVCPRPQCNVTSYDSNLSFSVASFSNYSAGVNSYLNIFDDVDNGTVKYTHEEVNLFANYTNRTSGDAITTAVCNLTFSDAFNATMGYSEGFYRYTRNFTTANFYYYNITCNATGFEALNTTDDITVLPGCGLPSPGVNWTIGENETVICSDENLFFQDQTLILGPNATFILNNSKLILDSASENKLIIIVSSSNFSCINSDVKSRVAAYRFNVQNNGFVYLNNCTLNKSILYSNNITTAISSSFYDYTYLQGNSTNNIDESKFYSQVFLFGNSTNDITSSNFTTDANFYGYSLSRLSDSDIHGRAYFYEGSYVEISGSTLSDTQFGSTTGSPVINFTLPRSTVLNVYRIRLSAPTIYGFVDFPHSMNDVFQSGTILTRNYPIQINYANSTPANNTLVNITNQTHMMWFGYTDEQGLVYPSLKFTNANYTENFTVLVNPTEDISLLADTPIQLTIDATWPLVYLEWPRNNSIDTDGNIIFYYNVSDDVGIENCSLVFKSEINQTNYTVSLDLTQNFTITGLTRGDYNWSVRCYDNSTNNNMGQSGTNNIEVSICGDNTATGNEQCDNNDFKGLTCDDFGYDQGSLICISCTILTGGCSDATPTSSSGGGGAPPCMMDWGCEEWSECKSGKSTRECVDNNRCTSKYERTEEMECLIDEKTEEKEDPFTKKMSGGKLGVREDVETADECGEDCISMEKPKPTSNWWFLLPLLLLLLLFPFYKRTIYTEEKVLKELIKEDLHTKYTQLHVIEDIYEKYKHHGNIHFKKFKIKKHKAIMDNLRNKYNMNHELAHLIALAHHSFNPIVFTKSDIPEEVMKKFKKIRFVNPLEG
ncbi:S8 family serine peptidase [candidate division KSB1 bacterium]